MKVAVRVGRDGKVARRDSGEVIGYAVRLRRGWEARRPGGFVVARGRGRGQVVDGLLRHVYGDAA